MSKQHVITWHCPQGNGSYMALCKRHESDPRAAGYSCVSHGLHWGWCALCVEDSTDEGCVAVRRSFVIRFPDVAARAAFLAALKLSDARRHVVEIGELLPDLLVFDVDEAAYDELQELADPETRFIEDFEHDLFGRGLGG